MKIAAFSFQVDDVEDDFRVLEVEGFEAISEGFRFEVRVAVETDRLTSGFFGRHASLVFHDAAGSVARCFRGIIVKSEIYASEMQGLSVLFIIEPRVTVINNNRRHRVFHDRSVKDIISSIFQESGLPSHTYRFNADKLDVVRAYCTQYGESDWQFVNRLIEEQGLVTVYRDIQDQTVLSIEDPLKAYTQLTPPKKIYRAESAMNDSGAAIQRLSHIESGYNVGVRLYDFDYSKADVVLRVDDVSDSRFVQEYYPGGFVDRDTGQLNLERHKWRATEEKEHYAGTSNCGDMECGCIFQIDDCDAVSDEQELLIVGVKHSGRQPDLRTDHSTKLAFEYSNRFSAVKNNQRYISRRQFEKPVPFGVQTAVVVGPKNEQIYTDSFGRVKIRFHWMNANSTHSKESCWLRVSQSVTGDESGHYWIPRIGQEVLVDFVNGNIDEPIIVGSARNSLNRPPYSLPKNKYLSGIRSRSFGREAIFNELSFDDSDGNEKVTINGARDLLSVVANDTHTRVGRHRDTYVQGSNTLDIEADFHRTIGNDELIRVQGSAHKSVEGDALYAIGGELGVASDGRYMINAKDDVIIQSKQSIAFRVGKNFIRITSQGIEIEGEKVLVNCGNKISRFSEVSVELPERSTQRDNELDNDDSDSRVNDNEEMLSKRQATLKLAAKNGSAYVKKCDGQ